MWPSNRASALMMISAGSSWHARRWTWDCCVFLFSTIPIALANLKVDFNLMRLVSSSSSWLRSRANLASNARRPTSGDVQSSYLYPVCPPPLAFGEM